MKIFSFFVRELLRRRVFSVVAMYAVAAWVMIQVGDLAIDAGVIAGISLNNLFVLAIIGLPFVLILGWNYDITKRGIVKTAPAGADESFEVSLLTRDYSLLLVFLAIWMGTYFYVRTPPAVGKSIAVMPFENRGNDPDNAQIAYGIHDDLLTQLQRISDLKLIARSSVEQIDPETRVQNIGQKLGVAYVMRGSVERVLDRIRINVVLIQAAEAQQAWSGSFDRELSASSLFDIRDEITKAITENLQSVLSPEEMPRVFDLPTISLEANLHYARGRQLLASRNVDDMEQALEEFKQAVEIDPEFALAWVSIADSTKLLMGQRVIGVEQALEQRKRAIDKALELNDQLGEAYLSLGDYLRLKGRLEKDEELREEGMAMRVKAIELSPNYAYAYYMHGYSLNRLEQREQKLAFYNKAAQLDPLSSLYQVGVARVLMMMGREEEAQRHLEFLLENDPEFTSAHGLMSQLHWDRGEIAESAMWETLQLKNDSRKGNSYWTLAVSYASLGDFQAAQEVRALAQENIPSDIFSLTRIDILILEYQADWASANELLDGISSDETLANFRAGTLANFRAMIALWEADFPEALEYYSEANPDWLDPHHWPRLIERPNERFPECAVAGLLIAGGEESLGQRLLRESLHFIEDILPEFDQHTDRSRRLGVCYLVEGRYEEALDYFETRANHGHFIDWRDVRMLPWWDPVRDHSRYIALERKIEELIAEQRQLLKEMDAPGIDFP